MTTTPPPPGGGPPSTPAFVAAMAGLGRTSAASIPAWDVLHHEPMLAISRAT